MYGRQTESRYSIWSKLVGLQTVASAGLSLNLVVQVHPHVGRFVLRLESVAGLSSFGLILLCRIGTTNAPRMRRVQIAIAMHELNLIQYMTSIRQSSISLTSATTLKSCRNSIH